MMSKLIPKLRFKEFSGEWEEIPILSIASMKARIGWQNLRQDEHLLTGEYYLITGTDFQDGIIDWQNAKYVEYDRYIQDKNIILIEGDILITKDGSIGKLAYVENIEEKKATLNNGIFRIRVEANNHKFIYYTFLSRQFKVFLNKLSAGSSINHLYQKDFETYKIILPDNKQEQQKIADCLSSLDNLIEAQNKKVEALKNHKKGLMQQLFPSDGEKVPKLRFDGFSGDWEEDTLGKFVKYQNGKAHEQDINESGEYIVVNSKFISTDGEVKKYTNNPFCIAKKDEVLMVLSDVPNGRAIAKCFLVDANNLYTVNQRICKLSSNKIVSNLLFYILNRNSYFLDFDDGVKQTNLKKDDVLSCPVLLPKDIDEQQKIANCLSSLDNLIQAQNRKVEALKNHKKGLMQQLFVSSEG